MDESAEAFARRWQDSPGTLEGSDFSEAVLTSVEFRRITLTGVKLPDPARHFFVYNWKCVIPRAIERATADGESGLGMVAELKASLDWAHPQLPVMIFSPGSYPATGYDNWGYVESLLKNAIQWCDERRH